MIESPFVTFEYTFCSESACHTCTCLNTLKYALIFYQAMAEYFVNLLISVVVLRAYAFNKSTLNQGDNQNAKNLD